MSVIYYILTNDRVEYLYRYTARFDRWERWNRKQPQNRVIRKWKRDLLGRKIGSEIVGPRPEPKIDHIFLQKKTKNGYIWENGRYQSLRSF